MQGKIKISEIRDIAENAKIYFLEGHVLKEDKFVPTTIEEEYFNKISSKNYRTTVFLISFVFIVLASTLVLTEYLMPSTEVVVSIDSFRTLDLAEIIQNIRYNQKELIELQDELENRDLDLDDRIANIENTARNRISDLNINTLGRNQYNIQFNDINTKREREIEELIKRYDSLRSDLFNKITLVENEVKQQQDVLVNTRTENIEQGSTLSQSQYTNTIRIDPNLELIIQNQEYRGIIFSLSNEIKENINNLNIAQSKLNALENESMDRNSLLAQIENLNKKNAELVNDINNRNLVVNNNIKTELNNLNQKYETLSNEYNAYVTNNEPSQLDSDIKKEFDNLNQRYTTLSNEYNTYVANNECSQLDSDIKKEFDNLNQRYTTLSNEYSDYVRNNESLQVEEIDNLNKRYTDLSDEYSAYVANNMDKYKRASIPIENRIYHRALEYLLLQRQDGAGYVISSDNANLNLFISSSHQIENGEKVFIFRGGNFLAELEITENSAPLAKAKIIRTSGQATINPFDIVLLSLNR